jgi:hypothetical protein
MALPGYPVPPQPFMSGKQPQSSGYYGTPSPSPALVQSQSSAGTSRNTPSQGSDSESSQEVILASGAPKAALTSSVAKGKRPSVNGLVEKRVSFAEKVSERSPSPVMVQPQAPAASSKEYNPTVKGKSHVLSLLSVTRRCGSVTNIRLVLSF